MSFLSGVLTPSPQVPDFPRQMVEFLQKTVVQFLPGGIHRTAIWFGSKEGEERQGADQSRCSENSLSMNHCFLPHYPFMIYIFAKENCGSSQGSCWKYVFPYDGGRFIFCIFWPSDSTNLFYSVSHFHSLDSSGGNLTVLLCSNNDSYPICLFSWIYPSLNSLLAF